VIPQLVQILIGLIGALLGVAVTWGSQRRTDGHVLTMVAGAPAWAAP
jgi:hypothetical protein